MKLAVAEANARGDLGVTLNYAESADAGDTGRATAAAQQLIADPSVVAVVGPSFSDPTMAAEPLYSAAGLASISPSATRPALTASGFTSFFRAAPSDDVQGAQAAQYVSRVVGPRTVYSVNDVSEYALPSRGFDARLRQNGVQVTSEGVTPTPDYGALAARVVAARPDFVQYSGSYRDLAVLARTLHATGYTGPIGASDGSKDDQLVALAGPDAEGIYLTTPAADPAGAPFAATYHTMFGVAPGQYSAEAYDAANAIISVLRQRGPDGISRAGVLDGIRSVDHRGLTRPIRFRANGDLVDATEFIYQVRSQRIAPLGRIKDLVR